MTPLSPRFAQKSHKRHDYLPLRYGDAMRDATAALVTDTLSAAVPAPGRPDAVRPEVPRPAGPAKPYPATAGIRPQQQNPVGTGRPQQVPAEDRLRAARPERPQPRLRRTLTRADWTATALDALARDGLRAVAVEPLAERLGATKGSFYWHFRDRNALLEAAVAQWERSATDDRLRELEAIADPRARQAALLADLTGTGSGSGIGVGIATGAGTGNGIGAAAPGGPMGAGASTGPVGAVGGVSTVGAVGKPGSPGAGGTGLRGTAGTAGTAGWNGSAGVAGPLGSVGAARTLGAAGTVGSGGTTGVVGSVGSAAGAGTVGSGGTSGVAGRAGSTGTPGSGGAAGTMGSGGMPGTVGSAGRGGAAIGSADQIAPRSVTPYQHSYAAGQAAPQGFGSYGRVEAVRADSERLEAGRADAGLPDAGRADSAGSASAGQAAEPDRSAQIFMVLLWNADHPVIGPAVHRVLAKRMAYALRCRHEAGEDPIEAEQAVLGQFAMIFGLNLLRRAVPDLLPGVAAPGAADDYVRHLIDRAAA